jgi:16S rRNA processing protein RimM
MSLAPPSSSPVNEAGSSLNGEPAFLAVGKLRHAHGVHGEILMEVYTDFPERLQPGIILFVEAGAAQLTITRRRTHREGLLLTFQGYSTPEAVSQLRNQLLYVKVEDRPPLAEGEYYYHQLIGLQVVSDTGRTLGKMIDILETGAADVLVIRPDEGNEVLIPMVDEFVKHVDLAGSQITVHLIPGMLPEEL